MSGATGVAAPARGIAGAGHPEARPIALQRHRAVHQHGHSHRLQPLVDRRPPRVDVVIAGDGEDAERRGELAEGLGERLDVAGVVVHLIPGDGDQVRPGLADRRRHPRQIAARGMGADMEIGDLNDPHPLEPGGQVVDPHVQAAHDEPARAGISQQSEPGQNRGAQSQRPAAGRRARAERQAGGDAEHPENREQGHEELGIPEGTDQEEPPERRRIGRTAEIADHPKARSHAQGGQDQHREPAARQHRAEQPADDQPAGGRPREQNDEDAPICLHKKGQQPGSSPLFSP